MAWSVHLSNEFPQGLLEGLLIPRLVVVITS